MGVTAKGSQSDITVPVAEPVAEGNTKFKVTPVKSQAFSALLSTLTTYSTVPPLFIVPGFLSGPTFIKFPLQLGGFIVFAYTGFIVIIKDNVRPKRIIVINIIDLFLMVTTVL